ncbi:MAG: 23S rRNA (uracil(1939)-C(5))-methyltransferase RlmD [Nitrospirota bacterium]|nr:MAG: 23S rRNA (uracil(1939)-C(5))-methyltransferase RlmD [Nitrospirota bacterium]
MLNSTRRIDGVVPMTAPDASGLVSAPPVLSIEKLVAGGQGLGRVGSQVVLVPGALPGEKLSVHIGDKRRGVHQAEIRKIIQSSVDRVDPSCSIAGQCGGCQFQHQAYPSQLIHKGKMLQDTLLRIGKLSVPDIPAVVPSLRAFHYRNKVRFVVFKEGSGFQLGFFKRGTRIPIQATDCLLIPEPAKELVAKLARWLSIQRTLPVFVESLEVRWSEFLSQGLLIFRGKGRHKHQARAWLEAFGSPKEVAGFIFEYAQSDRDRGSKISPVIAGQDHLIERFHELTVRIGHRSFLQANWPVYEALGEKLLEWGEDLKGHPVLELYAGVGALGMTLARRGALVTMVESNASALADARRSATLSHVGRCRFRIGTAETYLASANTGEYEAIILDPPRTGLSPKTIQELGRILVPRIFYVSCDPATLARDLSRLSSFGYSILRIQPFDMFPQTAHIETLVELTL